MANDFLLGEEASRSKLLTILTGLQSKGTTVLDAIETARVDTLIEFDRRLSAINSRRQRSNRVNAPQVACRFPVSDFLDIDQTVSTVTIRADSQSVTLKERSQPQEAVVKNTTFSASKGSTELIQASSDIYRVTVVDRSSPTGQFDLELVEPLTLNVLVFDIISTPSQPNIDVKVSADGIIYKSAIQVAINGYRINAWLPNLEVRFIRVQITPSHPDTIGGISFSFSITSFSALATVFHLRSDLVSKVITFKPNSNQIIFRADADPNITYYLSLQGNPFTEVRPDQVVPLPGTNIVSTPGIGVSNTGVLAHTVPNNAYLPTFLLTQLGTVGGISMQVPLRFAPGLLTGDSMINKLTNEYVGLNTGVLHLLRSDGVYDNARLFNVYYITGPSSMTAQLKVRMTTQDKAITPVFHGATIEEI